MQPIESQSARNCAPPDTAPHYAGEGGKAKPVKPMSRLTVHNGLLHAAFVKID